MIRHRVTRCAIAGVMALGLWLPLHRSAAPALADTTLTFTTAGEHLIAVIPGSTLTVELIGGRGGDGNYTINGGIGGDGADLKGQVVVPITANALYVEVGGAGRGDNTGFSHTYAGGFNGGGNGGANDGGAGGGASDIRTCSRSVCTNLSMDDTRLVVAGGGGGGGAGADGDANGGAADAAGGNTYDPNLEAPPAHGGAAGFPDGSGQGGAGGVYAHPGGTSGAAGGNGTYGQGGAGGAEALPLTPESGFGGGGGGGGYVGGGGGGGGASNGTSLGFDGAGGGGGSSWCVTSLGCTQQSLTTTSAAASVTITGPGIITAAPVARIHASRSGAQLHVRWTVARSRNLVGFNLYANGRKLTRHLVAVHPGRVYRVTVHASRRSALTLTEILVTGQEVPLATTPAL